ncbi:O-acetylhomoserine sulfhydrylase [Ignatzschineria indica]|uniref:O-acetylhomoserine sulfhydrylase n=1 Tax=Ignatzschineria indica TaxID=472583 RepID=A0A2U2AM11_9GAMM|nr:PLP-dependent transferase [Ignatzschineria indica]PWD84215.1 O-acetylhomoserine sulfhydrylase [Ignatzschineria indica]GGZ74775.1 O-acetylhomoserine sulfhydrylase [Ignatzschineria indica]
MTKQTEKEQQVFTLGFTSKILNSDKNHPDIHRSMNTPIYRSAAYGFPNAEAIAAAFQNREHTPSHTYSRISNPTVEALENKIKAISGARDVMMLSSGMAAISNTFMALAYAGSNIVTSPHLFGNSFSFFQFTLAEFGVEVRFVNTDSPAEIEAAIDENTVAFFCELVTNPHLEIADLTKIKPLLVRKKVPLIVDTTVVPWCDFDARAWGIDIEVVSTTKYISGGATSVGGAILDYGTFDWSANRRLAKVTNPAPFSPFMFKIKREIARNFGACLDADSAYAQIMGLETLKLRYQAMGESAYQLAQFLEQEAQVKAVNYPKLPSSSYKALSDQFFKNYPGAMLTFNLASKEACFQLMDALKIIRRATNLFDNRTLIIHPESTIYGTFSPELKKLMGIDETLLRLSVGLEELEDLKEDLLSALVKLSL